jgi:hypothetical protein
LLTAVTSPKRFVTLSYVTLAIRFSPFGQI